MKRRDLNPSVSQLAARLAAARAEATAAATAPAGNKALTGGADITWGQTSSTDAGDGESHGTWTQTGSVRDTAARVTSLEATAARLAEGIATAGRWNTVSTSRPPETTDGYPDGAWWVMVASTTDTTATACWQATGGQWASKPLPASQVVAPTVNAGLIDVALLAAKLITSDEFWTALTGQRAGFNKDGFQAYNRFGQRTVRLDGSDNVLMGTLRTGEACITSWAQGAARASGILFGTYDPSKADSVPRILGSWPDATSGADLILASGLHESSQGVLQFSHATGKIALTQQDGATKAGLTLRTDTQSYLGGYSKKENNSSGIQFGNGWVDFIGKLGTGLLGSAFRVGIIPFGRMNTGTINRTDVRPDGGGQVKPGYKWFPIVVVYDWQDGGQFVPKIAAADENGFRVVTECTAGSSDSAGVLYLAVRVDAW